MARIRTVKPELWTDEKIVECSIAARLLFIGMFNFSDDNGNLVNSPRRIKMQVFPADPIDCDPLIKELMTCGLLTEYSVNKVSYLNIKGFNKHQKINRPSKSTIPQMNTCEDSVRDHGAFSNGTDKEGKGKEEEEYNTQAADAACEEVIQPEEHLPNNVSDMAGRYAFEGNVVRLNARDYGSWTKLFPFIDLHAELQRLDIEFSHEKPKNWFNTASAKLNYQNKQAAHRRSLGSQRRVAGVSRPLNHIPEGFTG